VRHWFIGTGILLVAAFTSLGLHMYPSKRDELFLNLISEAAGLVAGGLVVYAIVELLESRATQREWQRVRDVLSDRIYLETETIHFAVQPAASWHIGNTLAEDLRSLIESGPKELDGTTFLAYAHALRIPLQSLGRSVTPRVVALAPDERLVAHLLQLEEAGIRLELIARGTSAQAPRSSEFASLIVQVLESAARLATYLDGLSVHGDKEKAAQARFDRLRALRIGSSWSSTSRPVRNPDGTEYQP
jgi:hypothetical protein